MARSVAREALAARLSRAGHTLPPAPLPRGLYVPAARVALDPGRTWLLVSGQTCRIAGVAQAGICRDGADVPAGAAAAEVAMLNALAALDAAAEGADVIQLVRLRGFVRASEAFTRHTAVLDAASQILALAFPGCTAPARTAVGVASLPDAAWVEIELEAIVGTFTPASIPATLAGPQPGTP